MSATKNICCQGACEAAQEGLECEYGRQSCCGATYPEVKLSCVEGLWQGYYVDTVCMFSGDLIHVSSRVTCHVPPCRPCPRTPILIFTLAIAELGADHC